MSKPSKPRIHGIPCEIACRGIRRALRTVLIQIRARSPRDYATIKTVVRGIVPLTEKEVEEGTDGEWIADRPDENDATTWGWGYYVPSPGVMKLKNSAYRSDIEAQATIAHELGHAVAVYKDILRRNFNDSEWASEATADYFAYKWGFGRHIARGRKYRCQAHHGVAPGQSFEVTSDGRIYSYRVSRHFVCHPIGRPRKAPAVAPAASSDAETADGPASGTSKPRRGKGKRSGQS